MNLLANLNVFVIAAYVLVMLGIGWFHQRRTKSAEDYLVGGRHMKPWSVGLSLFASLISTLSYLAVPGQIIKDGPLFLTGLLAFPALVPVLGWIVIPAIMKQPVMSAYELLEKRLGVGARMVGASGFLVMRLIWMAVIIHTATNVVLIPMLGLDRALAPYLCVGLGIITVAYTTLGGLRAVVATDVLQTAVMFLGALVVLASIARDTAVSAWLPSTWPDHWTPPRFWPAHGEDHSLFGYALMAFSWYFCTCVSDQIAIQRYLATKDAPAARRALGISLSADVLITLLLGVVGLALSAFYARHADLLPSGAHPAREGDQLLPFYITGHLPNGVSGLVIAALLSAAMSALAGGLNASCSVVTVDFLDRLRGTRRSDAQELQRARFVTLAIGGAVILLSTLVGYIPGNLFELCQRAVNLLVAPLAGLFIFALFMPRVTTRGAYCGTAAGLLSVVAINYWPMVTGQPGMSFLWAMPLGLAVQLSIGRACSPRMLRPSGESSVLDSKLIRQPQARN